MLQVSYLSYQQKYYRNGKSFLFHHWVFENTVFQEYRHGNVNTVVLVHLVI